MTRAAAAALAPRLAAVLAADRRSRQAGGLIFLTVAGLILLACAHAGLFDLARYRGALATLLTLAGDALPPDFARAGHWGGPLLDTLAMSVAGTMLGVVCALPLALVAARTLTPAWAGGPARLLLAGLRSIPGLIWGVVFVAAVGFGPLAGIFALASHSTGVLGKFYCEIFEHVDPAPGDAVRSHGGSGLAVARFAVWPQVLPRLIDATLYRWEHNVRSATTLGVVGAGGLGLEIVTAFHLFEYREAAGLILVVLALVAAINAVSGAIRRRLVGFPA